MMDDTGIRLSWCWSTFISDCCSMYPIPPCECATHTSIGIGTSSFDVFAMRNKMLPTTGPLPWVRMSLYPPSITRIRCSHMVAIKANCSSASPLISGGYAAFPPTAMTIRAACRAIVRYLRAGSVLGDESPQRGAKARHGCLHDAGPDDAHSWLLVRRRRIDDRAHAFIDDLADINAYRRSAEIERGQREAGVPGDGDARHLARVAERILRCAANELNHRRRGGHGKGAETRCFRNGAVAKIGIGVRF